MNLLPFILCNSLTKVHFEVKSGLLMLVKYIFAMMMMTMMSIIKLESLLAFFFLLNNKLEWNETAHWRPRDLQMLI